jgi:hypothetical protein
MKLSEGKAFPFLVKTLKFYGGKSGENKLRALSSQKKKKMENAQQLLFRASGLDFAKTHTNLQQVQGRRDKDRAVAEIYQPTPAYFSPGKGTQAAKLPDSKAGRAWRRSAKKLSRAAQGPFSGNRVGLPGRCRPTLAGTSLSTSFDARRWQLGRGTPISGECSQQGNASPVSPHFGSALEGAPGASGPQRTSWGRDSPFAFTCHRSGAAEPVSTAGGQRARLTLASKTPS